MDNKCNHHKQRSNLLLQYATNDTKQLGVSKVFDMLTDSFLTHRDNGPYINMQHRIHSEHTPWGGGGVQGAV